MRLPSFARRHPRIGLLIVVTIAVASWMLLRAPQPATESMPLAAAGSEASKPAGPPWLYGRADARFTVVGYADLECPYCRAYFPALKRWIDAHPEVNWQWHHLPLSMHEPAATAGARLAECAGETGGHATFWQAVAWLYSNTRGDGQGPPEGLRYPDLTPAMQGCLDSERPDAVIRKASVMGAFIGIEMGGQGELFQVAKAGNRARWSAANVQLGQQYKDDRNHYDYEDHDFDEGQAAWGAIAGHGGGAFLNRVTF